MMTTLDWIVVGAYVAAVIAALVLVFRHPCVKSHVETRHVPERTELHFIPVGKANFPVIRTIAAHDEDYVVCDERGPSQWELWRSGKS